MKKRILLLFLLCLALSTTACKEKEKKEIIDVGAVIGTEDMKVKEYGLKITWSYNNRDLNETTTYCSYVFVGHVEKYLETVDYGELGANTVYSVKVIENIKGELIDTEPIRLSKFGGNIKGTDNFFVYEDDLLPRVGGTYIFYTYVSEGIPSCGVYAAKPVNENYKESDIYKETIEACKNPVELEVRPSETVSIYDVNYKK